MQTQRIIFRQALGLVAVVTMLGLSTSTAHASVPEAWQERQNVCDSLSWYSTNPYYNPGAPVTHLLGKYKRLWWTSGEVRNGWVPVYSAGQEYWHTGWVRGECLVAGWPYASGGTVYW